MAFYDFTAKPPFTIDEAVATLADLPGTAVSLRIRLAECNADLLAFIASRFPELQELTLCPTEYGHPFGDTVVTADDFTAEGIMGVSTAKALAIAVGRDVGSRYATVLSPLNKLQVLSLGVSLYGPYGNSGRATEEPEVEDIERSMNVVASELIARALPKLQRIIWQNVTPDNKYNDVRCESEDEGHHQVFELHGLNFAIIRDGDRNFVRVEVEQSI